ncbi:MAG: Glucose/arabinose dehydrogenase, beta-propeller fold [Pelagibacterales bacterium]|nr:Glucose/arabinose dehydrogenase, beta-propeller fold [Pelagibacterales bacterium]
MNQKKIIYTAVISLILLLFLGFITVGQNQNKFAQSVKSLIPEVVKTALKKTIFAVPVLIEENIINRHKIDTLFIKNSLLESRIQRLENPQYLEKLKPRKITSKNNKEYNLELYKLPFPDHDGWALKPVAYLDKYNDKIFILSGRADIFYVDQFDKSFKYTEIASNIKSLIKDKKFYDPFILSIKDVLISGNKIYLTFGNIKDTCVSISVLVADINFEKLTFKNYFKKTECHDYFKENDMNYQHIGGRIVEFKNNKLLLSVGDFGYEAMAQDKNSIFGKIVSIDTKNNFNIFSMGSRNPQGLKYDKDADVIIHTEHGPTGGDEVNINIDLNNKKNFGWPVASYGVTSAGDKFQTHKENNFDEPIKYFVPSIGISEILNIGKNFDEEFSNDYFVTALGWKTQLEDGDNTIHHIRLNKEYTKIIYEDKIVIGERIRDSIYLDNEKTILMSLETIPAIGFLKK